MERRQLPVGVIQICWMQPGPLISPITNVFFDLITTDGDNFQPRPRSRAAPLPVPSVAIPALPFSPVKFSGLIERDLAFDTRYRLAMPGTNAPSESAAIKRVALKSDRIRTNQTSR